MARKRRCLRISDTEHRVTRATARTRDNSLHVFRVQTHEPDYPGLRRTIDILELRLPSLQNRYFMPGPHLTLCAERLGVLDGSQVYRLVGRVFLCPRLQIPQTPEESHPTCFLQYLSRLALIPHESKPDSPGVQRILPQVAQAGPQHCLQLGLVRLRFLVVAVLPELPRPNVHHVLVVAPDKTLPEARRNYPRRCCVLFGGFGEEVVSGVWNAVSGGAPVGRIRVLGRLRSGYSCEPGKVIQTGVVRLEPGCCGGKALAPESDLVSAGSQRSMDLSKRKLAHRVLIGVGVREVAYPDFGTQLVITFEDGEGFV